MLLIFYQISKNLVPIESTCNFNFIDCTSIWRSVALLLMHWWRRRDPADACTRDKLPPGIRRHTQATCMDGAVFPYFLDLWARLCTVCMSVVSRQRRRCSIALLCVRLHWPWLLTSDLLEKSRAVRQAPDERCFHIFYMMLNSATPEMKSKYHRRRDVIVYVACQKLHHIVQVTACTCK